GDGTEQDVPDDLRPVNGDQRQRDLAVPAQEVNEVGLRRAIESAFVDMANRRSVIRLLGPYPDSLIHFPCSASANSARRAVACNSASMRCSNSACSSKGSGLFWSRASRQRAIKSPNRCCCAAVKKPSGCDR